MTSNKGTRRQTTWLINLLIVLLLAVGGLGLYGLAQSQAALEATHARQAVATASARDELAETNRLHGRLRAAILLTMVLGIGCAAACGSGLPRPPEPLARIDAPEAEAVALLAVAAPESPRAEATAAAVSEPQEDWDGSNRRGPNRARNVARMPKRSASAEARARYEAVDDWEPF